MKALFLSIFIVGLLSLVSCSTTPKSKKRSVVECKIWKEYKTSSDSLKAVKLKSYKKLFLDKKYEKITAIDYMSKKDTLNRHCRIIRKKINEKRDYALFKANKFDLY